MVMPLSKVLVEFIIESKVVEGLSDWNKTIATVLIKPAIAPRATLIQ